MTLASPLKKGETFGLVGESGCGKSTTGRSIIRLHDVTSGNVLFDGKDIASLKESELKEYRKTNANYFPRSIRIIKPGNERIPNY